MASRRSRRSYTTFAVLALVAISILALSLGTASGISSGLRSVGSAVLSPVVGVVNSITRPIGNFFAGALNYGAVTSENSKLQAIVSQLEQDTSIQSFERHQLAQIAALQDLGFVGTIPTVTAQSIESNVSNFAASVQINRGSGSGVAIGMPVVGSGGLVGQVISVTNGTATIRLITDGQSRVGGVIGTTGANGVVNGISSSRPLAMNFVKPGSAVALGTMVFTNGLQGAEYPAGIPLGKVKSASTPENSTQMNIALNPAANLNQLGYVEVLLWEPPA